MIIKNSNTISILSTQMSRNFFNFCFYGIIIDDAYYELFKHFSLVAEGLSFIDCALCQKNCETLSHSALSFKNLKFLKFVQSELVILFRDVPNLSELFLKECSGITDNDLFILQKSMKHLKTFSLYCKATFEPKAYKRFYVHGLTYENKPSDYVLSLPAIKSFISERVSTLKELNLPDNLTPHALSEISSIENLSLYKIGLPGCHDCARSGSLINLFNNQPSLKIINLNVIKLEYETINSLCNKIPDIAEVHIRYCSLTDEHFSKIFKLEQLKTLDIGMNWPTESGFRDAVLNFKAVKLQSLSAAGIEIHNIDLLIRKCKYLVYLNLDQCKVSDSLLHFISENLIYLETLKLRNTDITDYGLTGVSDTTQDKNKNLKNEGSYKPISNLKYLKILFLTGCTKITVHGITSAIRFQYLVHLEIYFCTITSQAIDILFQQNPRIERLYSDCLYNVSNITIFKTCQAFI